VAHFRDYGPAHRARRELIQIGIPPNCMSIVAGDLSTGQDPAVRGITTLLAVHADGTERARVAEIIEHNGSVEIEELDQRGPLGIVKVNGRVSRA
jgi:hypothetical protein